jgi:2-polyprenyl-6-hydroxyphenyl methylase/3-demethylubiquinone-9 3-methyltransferase
MRGRLHLCPYEALPKHLSGADTILDIGCGFGHLAWYLADTRPDLRYFGADVDERKVALAEGSTHAALAERPAPAGPGGPFPDAPAAGPGGAAHPGTVPAFRHAEVTSAPPAQGWPDLDVLYLLPWEAQVRLLEWALLHLDPAPGSALVLKSMEQAEGVSGFRALAEEWVMVHVLRRTRSSGTLLGARPASDYADFARERGWNSVVEDLGTYNPSYLLRIHR